MKNKKDKRRSYWFVVPKDQVTNEAIIRALGPDATIENEHPRLKCCDGKERPAWQVLYSIITQLKHSKNQAPFSYEVYVRQEGSACAKPSPFEGRKSKLLGDVEKKLNILKKKRKS